MLASRSLLQALGSFTVLVEFHVELLVPSDPVLSLGRGRDARCLVLFTLEPSEEFLGTSLLQFKSLVEGIDSLQLRVGFGIG